MTHHSIDPPASVAVLPPSSLAIVRAMALGEVAWQDAYEIAEVLGWSLDSVQDEIAILDDQGWLEVWERPDAPTPFVTFSPLGATRLGLRLIEVGPTELPRWAYPSEPDPPLLKAKGVSIDPLAAGLVNVIDDTPGPHELSERSDTRLLKVAPDASPVNINALPLPIFFRGQNQTWHGAHRADARHRCPGCRCHPLGPREYCLVCDRWGLDYLISKTNPDHASSRRRGPDRRQQASAFRELMKMKRQAHRQRLRKGE